MSDGTTESRRLKFPTAFTVLAIVLLAVWIASFVIPSGTYETDPKTGGPKPGSYRELPSCDAAQGHELCVDKSLRTQFSQLWTAPPNGLYGIENAKGRVGGDEEGLLYGSAKIFLFVLAVGAFITVTMRTGAIQTGIGRLALRYRNSGAVLVVALMLVFAIGGTTYGMWEETLGFFPVLVPLVLALGYDRLIAVAMIFFGCGTGTLASTVNPFATGVASDAAGISVGDGIALRLVMWVVLVSTAIGYVLWYGRRVRTDPSRSIVGFSPQDAEAAHGPPAEVPPLTRKQKIVLGLFALAFAIMIYGFVPWDDVMDTVFGTGWPLPTFSTFYFAEATTLFFVFAVIIGVIARLREEDLVNTIVSGAGEFIGPALIIVFARAITVVMKNAYITDTILHAMEDTVSGTSSSLFAVLAMIVNLPIAFLVPSSSGHAALVMPILAPLADFAGVPRSLAVTAYQSASGLVNYITPTAAVVMGGLALSKVGYDKYLRFALPLVGLIFVNTCVLLAVGAALS
jgi:uncharacterized ion transporter superfamily protein YfcC